MAKHKKHPNVVIRRHDSIGTGDAESDTVFQNEAFIDTGEIDLLRDTYDSRRLVIGRTGTGKTLLSIKFQEYAENVKCIDPKELAMQYVSNSRMINFAENMGAHLDNYFNYLWQHVLTIELLKMRFSSSGRDFVTWIHDHISKDNRGAKEYLEHYSARFWDDTEKRVKELTDHFESQLSTSCNISPDEFSNVNFGGKLGESQDVKTEVLHKAETVIDNHQFQKLSHVIKAMDSSIFADKQKKFYILIDNLDEDWAHEPVKYRLIKALIEASSHLKKVRNAKIILFLRQDLFDKVLEETKIKGDQEEKYRSVAIHLKWTDDDLIRLVDARVSTLFRRKYTTARVNIHDLLPNSQIDKRRPLDYLLSRTLKRPRDIIRLFNACLSHAEGYGVFTRHIIKSAERSYSAERLRSIQDEWRIVYPNLGSCINLLHGVGQHFTVDDIDADRFEEFVLYCAADEEQTHRDIRSKCIAYGDGRRKPNEVIVEVLYHLYLIGVVGVKVDKNSPIHWSFEDNIHLTSNSVTERHDFYIHPTFWFALGVGS